VKEHPILFSAPMVRAILEGRKTMTRRVVSPRIVNNWDGPRGQGDIDAGYPFVETRDGPYVSAIKICPYGQPGDRLWVRETFCPTAGECEIPAIYRASYEEEHLFEPYWKPSIFMPRALSRILLEVTSVRVERVQDITRVDAMAEGIEDKSIDGLWMSPESRFAELWDSINAKRGYGWDVNPWVWGIEFRRVAA
jgi:hypothetical protein